MKSMSSRFVKLNQLNPELLSDEVGGLIREIRCSSASLFPDESNFRAFATHFPDKSNIFLAARTYFLATTKISLAQQHHHTI